MNHPSAAHIVTSYEARQTPIGIGYMGGLALFDPASKLLSPREWECTTYAMAGLSNCEIGSQFYLSEDTIKTNLYHTMRKVDAISRSHLLERCLDPETGVMLLIRNTRPGTIADLSDREKQVARLVAMGETNAAIGAELFLTKLTIKSHLACIARKTFNGNRSVLALASVLSGLTDRQADPNRSIEIVRDYTSLSYQAAKRFGVIVPQP